MRYFCWKLEKKTAGVLGGLSLTGRQDGGNPTWTDLISTKFGTKNAHKTTTNCTHRQYPLQSLHIYAKLVNNCALIACIILFFFEFSGVPTPNLGKLSEVSTAMWRHTGSDESVSDRYSKTIESPPPSWAKQTTIACLFKNLSQLSMSMLEMKRWCLSNLL